MFAEDDAQREKLRSVQDELPALREIVSFAQLPELETEGRAHAAEHPDALDAAAREIQEEDLGTLIYTSGTTGPPKGCMLTHKNLVTAAIHVRTNLEDGSDTVLLFLPLAHTFGRLAHQAAAYYGSTVALVADATRVAEALGAVRPTILPAVPRIYEKIHAGVLDRIEGETGDQALARALGARRRRAREPPPPHGPRRPARPPDPGAHRRQARLREGQGAARRPPPRRRLRRGAARPQRARVLPLARDARDRGLRADGDRELAQRQRPRRVQVRHRRPRRRGLRDPARHRRRDPRAQRHRVRRLLQGARGDGGRVHERRLVPDGRRRRDRRRRLREDHRPQEGPDHHRRRQEHRAAEPRERAQGVALRVAGARRRRPAALCHRADHARVGRGERGRARSAGARAGDRRRRQPRPRARGADQALLDPPA